ncbi:hypothetical protein [Kaarinaea lacus]
MLNKTHSLKFIVLISILCLLPVTQVSAEGKVLRGVDEDAQLPFWEWRSDTVSLRLVQRLPDQTRAFFVARGFNKEHAERIAQSCIFQTVYKNVASATSQRIIKYDLTKWKITSNGKVQSLKTREVWEQEWNEAKVPASAKIAFSWSLIPTQQSYQPQDYNWGMTSYNLPPGTRFDLKMVWTQQGIEHSGIIRNIECAPDIHLDPKEAF